MQMDASASRVLCIEEPENGIHPFEMGQVVSVLRDYAVDPEHPIDGTDNPLRQVILNTHSPEVVKHLDHTEVLFVETASAPGGSEARVRPVDHPKSWRRSSASVGIEELERWIGGAPVFPPWQRSLFSS